MNAILVGVGDRAAHGTGRVLQRRNRHDAPAAHQAERGLEPDDAVQRGGRQNRAVGLGADGARAEGQRRGHRGARARAGRIALARIGVARLAAEPAAPAARGPGRAGIRPLAEIGLAEHQRPGGAQARGQRRIGRAHGAGERQGARGGRHRITGLDVVLEDDRYPVQRPAQPAGLALLVERARGRHGAGIERQHRAIGGAVMIEARDAQR